MIKGQDRLYRDIDLLIDNFPHSVLLIGEEGSGKHIICDYIADKLGIDLIDISENISNEFIDEINASQTKTLYTVNIQKISLKEQNILLKLYEEPSEYTYIVLKSVSDQAVIETLLNRSYILKMNSFSKEILSEYITKNDDIVYILDVCTTPGQVEIANRTDMKKLKDVCCNLLDRLHEAPLFNVLSVVNKINFSDEYGKFDLFLFLKVLNYECTRRIDCLDIYLIFKNMSVYINSMNNKKSYFERCLIDAYEYRKAKK